MSSFAKPLQLTQDQPYSIIRELEPNGTHGLADVLTVFLTAATCPIGCHMCDLHRFTLPGPIEEGMIPRQIRHAIRFGTESERQDHGTAGATTSSWIKLYNSGNFFDGNSIPTKDHAKIATLVSGFDRVVVENHPKFGKHRMGTFRQAIEGRLEVAVGLETVQPRWLSRMGKQMSRDTFDSFAKRLREFDIDLRVFLIVGVPGSSVTEALRWAKLSIRHAILKGARHISLIPARRGHGWGTFQQELPGISALHMEELQRSAIESHSNSCVITVDLWDLVPEDRAGEGVAGKSSDLSKDENSTQKSLERIELLNRTQLV